MNQEHHHEPQRPTNQSPMGQMRSDQPAVAKWLWIALVIVAVFGGFFLAWYLLMGPGKTPVVTNTTIPAITIDPTADWKTYTNATYGYTIKYPTGWVYAQSKAVDVETDEVKNTSIDFKLADANKITIITEAKAKNAGVTLTQFATDFVTPADKATITTKTATKIGSIDGFQELVTISDPASKGLWYFTQSTDNFYVFVTKEATQSSDIKSMLSTFKLTTATSSTTATTPTATTSLTYTNAQYGFNLTFPSTWKGYKMKEATIEGITATYYINIPTTDTSFQGDTSSDAGYFAPFAISVYTLDQWTAAQAAEGPNDTLIVKGDTYVFAWSQANGIPATDFTMSADIKTIIASLKLN